MSQFSLTDLLYLDHILECISRIEEYTADGREKFEQNGMARDAVLRNLQVLAESTQRLSDAIKDTQAAIPWKQIAGFRHRLVHDYFRIDQGLIWRVCEQHLPELKIAVTQMRVMMKA